jgi:3-oxoacyl-[acyl-carrier protein] reductase
MKARFENQVVIVTGGSRGIGRSIALQFGREAAKVVVNYLQAVEAAETVVDEIQAAGGEALACQGDVTSERDVKGVVRAALGKFGRIDILVANAGSVRDGLIAAMSLEQWETVIQTNLRGPFLCIREIVPFMMRQKSGNIVLLSSIAAEMGGRGHANYVAAKGGVNAMTRSLAVELAPKHIRVNAVAPGMIVTDMSKRVRGLAADEIREQIPLRRFGEPGDVAQAVCFLASDAASYITGEVVHVTGGMGL